MRLTYAALILSTVLPVLSQPTYAAGSWAADVGGNLKTVDGTTLDCRQFVAATFARVQLPVFWGVDHEFIGVTLTTNNGDRYYVTGLNGDGDLAAYTRHAQHASDEVTSQVLRRITSCATFSALVRRINRGLADSVYNDPTVYALAMIARPLTGQPCSNAADYVQGIVSSER